MKYQKEYYDENVSAWVCKDIDKKEAVWRLSCFYDNPEELAETPAYYRTYWGGVEVIAQASEVTNSEM